MMLSIPNAPQRRQPATVPRAPAKAWSCALPFGGRLFELVKGRPQFTATNAGSLSAAASRTFRSAYNSSNGYFSRSSVVVPPDAPWSMILVHTPNSISGSSGLFAISDGVSYGSPRLYIQRNAATCQLYFSNEYKLDLTNAFKAHEPSTIVVSMSVLTNGAAATGILAVNGASLSATDTNENGTFIYEFLPAFLGGAGHWGLYYVERTAWPRQKCIALSRNPWQVFGPQSRPIFFDTGAGATAPTLSDLRAINVGATSTQWSIDYTFS